MNTPLTVYLLAISIAVGDYTLDESCSNSSGTCTGTTAPCPIGFDKLCTLQLESTGELQAFNFHSLLKICVKPRTQDDSFMVLNMGKAGTILSNLNCCTGIDCKKRHVMSRNKTFNGKACPTCFALSPLACQEEEVVLCAGDENYCLDILGTITFLGKFTTWITMKGCANKAACNDLQEDSYSIPWGTVLETKDCKPASRGVMAIPALLGYFLSVLTGFQALEAPCYEVITYTTSPSYYGIVSN